MADHVAFGDYALDASLASIIGRNVIGGEAIPARAKLPRADIIRRIPRSAGIVAVASLGAAMLVGLGLRSLGDGVPRQSSKVAANSDITNRNSLPSDRPIGVPSIAPTPQPVVPLPGAPATDTVEASPPPPAPTAITPAPIRALARPDGRRSRDNPTAQSPDVRSRPNARVETVALPAPEPAVPVETANTRQSVRADAKADIAPKAPEPPVNQPKPAGVKVIAAPPEVAGRRDGIDAIRMLRRQ